jgi:hypothetical protein
VPGRGEGVNQAPENQIIAQNARDPRDMPQSGIFARSAGIPEKTSRFLRISKAARRHYDDGHVPNHDVFVHFTP